MQVVSPVDLFQPTPPLRPPYQPVQLATGAGGALSALSAILAAKAGVPINVASAATAIKTLFTALSPKLLELDH